MIKNDLKVASRIRPVPATSELSDRYHQYENEVSKGAATHIPAFATYRVEKLHVSDSEHWQLPIATVAIPPPTNIRRFLVET